MSESECLEFSRYERVICNVVGSRIISYIHHDTHGPPMVNNNQLLHCIGFYLRVFVLFLF